VAELGAREHSSRGIARNRRPEQAHYELILTRGYANVWGVRYLRVVKHCGAVDSKTMLTARPRGIRRHP
jgi:hypothetical protein